MAGCAYSTEDALHETTGPDVDSHEVRFYSDASAGIFSLRRNQYFNRTQVETASGHRAAADPWTLSGRVVPMRGKDIGIFHR